MRRVLISDPSPCVLQRARPRCRLTFGSIFTVRTRIKSTANPPTASASTASAVADAASSGNGSADLLDGLASSERASAVKSNAAALSELRFAQLGIAQLSVRTLDPAAVHAELEARITAAPQLFTHAPLVLDFSALNESPDARAVNALFDAVRAAGMLPIGLTHGSDANDALARTLDLPLFAKFRAQIDSGAAVIAAPAPIEVPVAAPTPPVPSKSTSTKAAPASASPVATSVGMHHAQPVRSGQQVYARGRDLTLTAMVGNGAEVIADGSIHVYGVLRGRALAGAAGDTTARIFCHNFQAELISIAGQYRVFEDIPAELRGKSVHAWLEGDKLLLAPLA